MGFFMEFVENYMRERWVGYEEDDRKFRERVEANQKNREKNKKIWRQPTLPFGYWRSIKYNRVYYQRQEESNWKGKRDPLDLIKPDPFAGLERPHWDF